MSEAKKWTGERDKLSRKIYVGDRVEYCHYLDPEYSLGVLNDCFEWSGEVVEKDGEFYVYRYDDVYPYYPLRGNQFLCGCLRIVQ